MKPDPQPTLDDLQAMPGVLPVPQILRVGPKTQERKAQNDPVAFLSSLVLEVARQPHIVNPEWMGTGLNDWARMRCTCGWCGPKRFGYEEDQSDRLARDKSGHLQNCASL